MATVYSLIAWGGRTGKTVSLSASTDVVTLTNHGLRDGTKLWPSGTLPAELNTSTPVYARSTADNTFTLHTSSAGAIANTGQITFAGSSTYAAVVLKSDLVANAASALAPYGLSDLSRWGSSGSERIYDGLTNWRSVRNGATTAYDTEIAELGEAFVETITSEITLNMACAETKITSLVNGVRSSAFHAGYVGSLLTTSGYCLFASGAINGLNASGGNITIDGFAEHIYNSGSFGVTVSGYNTEVKNMLIRGGSGGSMCAIQLIQPAVMSKIHHNIILETGWVALYSGGGQGAGSVIYNNLIHDCYVGFYGEGSLNRGTYYNNIAVGNATNWHSSSPSNMVAAYNFGESTGNTPWNTGATTYVNTMVSGDFVDYANHDFTTSSASAHQVDAAIAVPLAAAFDLLGNEASAKPPPSRITYHTKP